jgi:hypothetical protein
MLIVSRSFVKIVFFLLILLIVFGKEQYAQTKDESGIQQEKEVKTSISYCNLEISKAKKLANLSFNVHYIFEVNENGEAVEIRKLRDDYVGEEIIKSCISNWRVTGVPNKTWFRVYFFWSHSKGWFRQTVSSTKFSQVMEIEGVGIEKPTTSRNVENTKILLTSKPRKN